MAFESGALDATIAAAAGDDAALIAELRATFVESARRQLDLLRRSRCDGNWSVAAMRLKGLAASFHVEDLMQLAQQALDGVPGDPAILRQIDGAIQKLSGN
ncbi:MAG: Hpt domain-containing protein [Erythrobacter sp.]|nr:Hpt domain-containing protein [Erythrobacter sp.]